MFINFINTKNTNSKTRFIKVSVSKILYNLIKEVFTNRQKWFILIHLHRGMVMICDCFQQLPKAERNSSYGCKQKNGRAKCKEPKSLQKRIRTVKVPGWRRVTTETFKPWYNKGSWKEGKIDAYKQPLKYIRSQERSWYRNIQSDDFKVCRSKHCSGIYSFCKLQFIAMKEKRWRKHKWDHHEWWIASWYIPRSSCLWN